MSMSALWLRRRRLVVDAAIGLLMIFGADTLDGLDGRSARPRPLPRPQRVLHHAADVDSRARSRHSLRMAETGSTRDARRAGR